GGGLGGLLDGGLGGAILGGGLSLGGLLGGGLCLGGLLRGRLLGGRLLGGGLALLGHAVGCGKVGEGVHESSFTHLGDAADAARRRESLKLRQAQAAERGAVAHGVGGKGGVGHDWIVLSTRAQKDPGMDAPRAAV